MAEEKNDRKKQISQPAAEHNHAQDINESRRQVLDVLESISDGFFALDSLWRFTYINKRAQQLLNINKEDVLFKKIWDKLPNVQVLRLFKELNRAAESKTATSFEEFIEDIDRWFEFHIYPYEHGLSVYFTDITERKKVEEALRDSETRFRKIFEEGPLGMVFVDLDFRFVKANSRFSQMLGGYTEEELTKLTFPDITHPEDIGKDVALAQKFSRGETPFFQMEKRYIRKDGGIIWVNLTASIIRDESGNPCYFLGMIEDISERKRVEKRLKESSETLETVIENTNALIAYLDPEMNFIMANDAYVAGSGHTRDELIGHNHFDLFPNEENEAIFKRVRDTGEPIEFKAKPFEYADQPWRGVTYWDWILVPVKDPSGQVIGLVLSLVDVTETVRSKQLGDALNNINALISSTLDYSEIMKLAVVEATKAIRCEAAAIIIHENNYWTVKYIYGYPTELIGTKFTDEKAKASHFAATTKQPVIINDAYNDERVSRDVMLKYSIRSLLSIPLVIKEEVIGNFLFIYRTEPITFADYQVDFATKLAASVSLAIENAGLYALERTISDTLQEALLTVPEHIEGVEYGYLYRSATEAARVGGDFFDIFELEHDQIGMVIGDVSGKGLEAATLTSLVRNTIRAYAYEDISPASIMAKTNNAVKKAVPMSNFITVFFGIVNMRTGGLTYCSAGHPPAIIKRKENGALLLATSSPIIGAFPGIEYVDDTAVIKKGDILLLYTDGIIEARCNGDFFGEERLVNFIGGLKSIPAKELPQLIFDEVMRCTGGELSDDVALFSLSAEVKPGD